MTTTKARLVHKTTRATINVGDMVKVGGESMKLIKVLPPRHEGSTGRVIVQAQGSSADELREYEYYPSVIGAEWVTGFELCSICGENDAEVKISVTNMEGEMLDTGTYCRECVRGELGVIGLVIGSGEVTNG